jgi:hypothetical protein
LLRAGGYIEGDIRVGGYPKVQETFARISGYVEQNDIHSPQLTVLESLRFSAWLRLSEEIDKDTRNVGPLYRSRLHRSVDPITFLPWKSWNEFVGIDRCRFLSGCDCPKRLTRTPETLVSLDDRVNPSLCPGKSVSLSHLGKSLNRP